MTRNDSTIFTFHKNEIKETQRKDLGKTMSVFTFHMREWLDKKKTTTGIKKAITLFPSFDENTGVTTYFFPKTKNKKIQDIEQFMQEENIDINTTKNNKHNAIILNKKIPLEEYADFFLTLAVIYGKWEIKKNILMSLKIQMQIPQSNQEISEEII